MFSFTVPNIASSQNTPIFQNIRRIVTRPSGASCSSRNSAEASLATILNPQRVWPKSVIVIFRATGRDLRGCTNNQSWRAAALLHFRDTIDRIGAYSTFPDPFIYASSVRTSRQEMTTAKPTQFSGSANMLSMDEASGTGDPKLARVAR